MDTDKFTVADATGNTSIDGTLDVIGATTLSSTLDVSGDLKIDGNATTTGITTLSDDLKLNGYATATAASGDIETEGTLTIGGGTAIAEHLSASASFTFSVIGANDCKSDTTTVSGVADGNTVSLGMPDSIASASSTLTFSGWVSAADTVSVRVCQVAGTATKDFAATDVRVDVWKH